LRKAGSRGSRRHFVVVCSLKLATRGAIVIGAGPNGLTAAILLAKAGLRTTVFEAADSIGGGARSAELALPGFVHDICSAVHPLAIGSPAFANFPLAAHGLEWIQPPIPLAHPFDDGSAAVLSRSIEKTRAALGSDGDVYARVASPFVRLWQELASEILQPIVHLPRAPLLLAQFGWQALQPASSAARRLFRGPQARALFGGLAAHSLLPLHAPGSAAYAWVLAIAGHAAGWPIPRGGAQRIADALASYFESLGGTIITNTAIRSIDEFERDALILCDVTPRQFLEIAGDRLSGSFRNRLKAYRYGPGVFKIDWALSRPVPWRARECTESGTVHLGASLEEIERSEENAAVGRISERPFVLFVQPSLFDASRAPAGQHTAWAYCHVPNGSQIDMTARIEAQVERFAPGFGDAILARHTFTAAQLERHNANLVGGDISGGLQNLTQLVFRPTRSLYRTPLPNVYLCSASTPPGGGVHGMCGYHAARLALRDAGVTQP
jgi:phytoene dehydrogenase-like protein